jgi:hypothetical protein
MPWVRFDLERGRVEETEMEVFLRGHKKVPENDTPVSEEIAIFVSVDNHTDTERKIYDREN